MAIETERKFTIGPKVTVPDLTGVVTLGDSRLHNLRAVYFDTPDFLLARNRRTLRRRTGGGDAGWHLKLPASGADPHSREEVHLPLTDGPGASNVPHELRARVAEIIEYSPLVPVVELITTRQETELHDLEGGLVALLCDDTVTATRNGKVRTWRELEIELAGSGTPATLDVLTETLGQAGVDPSESVSKLVHALGKALAKAEEATRPSRKASAAAVIGAYMSEQIGVIQGREAEVRVDAPDSVHKMRVGVRRLRSALRTFRPFLDRDRVQSLRAELKWLGEMLGGPRDAEVLAAHLIPAVDGLPEDALIGPVRERVTAELDVRHSTAHAALVQALDSDRFRELMDALVDWVVAPPFNEYAAARAKGLLPERLEQVGRRTVKEWKQAEKLQGHDQLVGWHETRKRAKAARYAWEAAVPALGDTAVAAAEAWEQVTESLGTVQDAVVAREALKELAEIAASHGEATFSYGVLYQREIERTDDFHAQAADAIATARDLSGSA
ncbi:CHAD domain-containing protein [Granulicoccus sp. GXG6511]|uniref:CYTH and CHAD domain-containing protein n=1 Tax=Granulicoccus sp. GXG6511 TaxID=3381351 RepID=UPI003D7CEB21